MEVEEVDLGRAALAELQALILRARQIGFHGGNLQALYEEQIEDMMSALFRLDRYLTGKTENRREDKRDFRALFVDGRMFFVHLSDGGYSRLTINLEDGHPVFMDRTLSREPVKKRWAELVPPS